MKNKKFQYVIYGLKSLFSAFQEPAQRGFLLLEVMAALIMFCGLSLVIAKCHVSIEQWNNQARNYLQATHIATQECEQPVINIMQKNSTYDVGIFHVERTVLDCPIPSQCAAVGFTTQRLNKTQLVKVKISWVAMRGHRKSLVFESVSVKGFEKKV